MKILRVPKIHVCIKKVVAEVKKKVVLSLSLSLWESFTKKDKRKGGKKLDAFSQSQEPSKNQAKNAIAV